MLLLLEIKRHILRVPGRTLITALTAALLVCGMALYLCNIQSTQDTLEQLAAQMPVRVRITSRDGSAFTNLRIETEDFDAFAAQNVRDLLCTSAFSFRLDSVDGQSVSGFMRAHAANEIAALDGPSPEDFIYLSGWDARFWGADEPVCAVERSFAESQGIRLGSRLGVDVFSLRREQKGCVAHDEELTVVALYEDGAAGHGLSGWNATMPIGRLRSLTEAATDRNGEPFPFFYDSASAYLVNPREMNAFKDAMLAQGFRQSSPLPDRQDVGDALSIDDEMYIKTSSRMVESLQLYRACLVPFFGLIILAIGLITFLCLRSCRIDIAIASSLGRQKLLNAAAPFCGTVIVQAGGCILGLGAMGPIAGFTLPLAGAILGLSILCAAAGTALASAFLFHFDPLTLLTKAD